MSTTISSIPSLRTDNLGDVIPEFVGNILG